jgi:hypothetical protein
MKGGVSIIAIAALLAGCSYPSSQTDQGQKQGSLFFPNAVPGAHAYVDGADVGFASAYDGKTVLGVVPGTHRVEIRGASGTLLQKTYYVDAGARVGVQ